MASPRIHGRVSKMDTLEAKRGRKDSKWEILSNLEHGTAYTIKPKKMEGMLTKRRKWPLKGWHKRYFILDSGYLIYGKSASEVNRGRTHGKIDVGLSVISAKTELFRIDIDDENFIHHLKAGDVESFGLWLEQLQQHRFYRQNQINASTSNEDSVQALGSPSSLNNFNHSPRSSLNRGLKPPTGTRSILQEFNAMDERMTNQMLSIQQNAVSLGLIAQKLEDDYGSGGPTKQKNFFGLRKKKSGTGTASNGPPPVKSESNSRSSTLTSLQPEQQPRPQSPSLIDMDINDSTNLAAMAALSSSNPSLASTLSVTRPVSMPADAKSLNFSLVTREELVTIVQDLQHELATLVRTYTGDKEKLKALIVQQEEQAQFMNKTSTLSGNMQQLASLRQAYNQAMTQNASLRAKLQKIHMDSELCDMAQMPSLGATDTLIRGLGQQQSLSYSSSCISEFFDAREYSTEGGAPSEYSSDEDFGSENGDDSNSTDDEMYEEAKQMPSSEFASLESPNSKSEPELLLGPGMTSTLTRMTGRRQKLPAIKADTAGLNLWNLLTKNIGKDLSKISMPVTLNEPLSALQRLCEELEYSELLDKAATSSDPVERMTLVAAFAVSAYGYCTARAGHKPFNPLLGETYECIREDKGFKYVAEQVSHHPPVSTCHAQGKSWTWWQDFRVKTKFWGKSMEFQPDGVVNLLVVLPDGSKEQYTWNKITTCIHNLFSSGTDRWADLYGECHIQKKSLSNATDNNLACKLEFLKASGYWTTGKRHEVIGTINGPKGKILQHLFGICTEALYCGQAPSARCVWRPGALPNDSELFYGFSRFAIELNEILESERAFLPITDTRYRPDQRALEEGLVSEAETLKLKLEQAQRERRLRLEEEGAHHYAQWFRKDSQCWMFTDEYWDKRADPGFKGLNLMQLW